MKNEGDATVETKENRGKNEKKNYKKAMQRKKGRKPHLEPGRRTRSQCRRSGENIASGREPGIEGGRKRFCEEQPPGGQWMGEEGLGSTRGCIGGPLVMFQAS